MFKKVNFSIIKQQEIKAPKKQAQSLSKNINNDIEAAAESSIKVKDSVRDFKSHHNNLMTSITEQWNKINEKICAFKKDKIFLDNFPTDG